MKDNTTDRLYKIVQAKLMSLGSVSAEEWHKIMEERGIASAPVGRGPPPVTYPFRCVPDPLYEVVAYDFSRPVTLYQGALYIPVELATKMLVLGGLP